MFDIVDAAKVKDRGRSYELLTVSRPLLPTPKVVAIAQNIETLDPNGFQQWKQGCIKLTKKGANKKVSARERSVRSGK